ncbi:unnamed protein product, partial [Choristocarpus tenellus]
QIKRNCTLTHLDISANRMGEKNSWGTSSQMMCVPSAGPTLGRSLHRNKTLVLLNAADNKLGSDTGEAFAHGVGRHKSLTSLDLSNNLLLPTGGKAIALCLNSATRSSVTSLNIATNHLGHKVSKLFGVVLRKNINLRYLDLSNNELRTRAGVAIANALRVNQGLASLSLRDNKMGSNAAKAFGQALAESPYLTALDLSGNSLGISSAEGGDCGGTGTSICQGLKRNSTLTSLSLAGSAFTPLELQRVTESLPSHPSLIALNLSGEKVEESSAHNIANFLSGAGGHVQTLLLPRGGRLTGLGALAVTNALASALDLVHINISDNPLGLGAVQELAHALVLPTGETETGRGIAVRRLELARCDLGEMGGTLLAQAIGCNQSIEELDLSGNSMGPAAGKALARSLRTLYICGKEVRPCRIKRLDVSHNPLGNKAGIDVLQALVNRVTEHIDISFTELESGAGNAIGSLLRNHTIALRFLNVEHNRLGRQGANSIFWALRRNLTLRHLDISDNNLGPVFGTNADKVEEYGTAISSALSLNQTIEFLDLGTNRISSECGVAMASSIRKNRSLSSVYLENNELDDDAAASIALKLRNDRQLTTLNIANNRIRWKGGVDLAEALSFNFRLVRLNLGKNDLGDGGTHISVGEHFGKALMQNKTLTQLNLEDNRLGPAGGIAIGQALRKNNTLLDINLENNRFDKDVGIVLEELLRVNVFLEKIAVSPEEISIDSRRHIDELLAHRQKFIE